MAAALAAPVAAFEAEFATGVATGVATEFAFPPARGLEWNELPRGIPDLGKIDPEIWDESRLAIIPAALKWLGTPYAFGGFGPEGLDCSGFVYRVLAQAAAPFGPFPRSSESFARFGARVEGEPDPGDILVFAREGAIYHVAIALSKDRFIHSASEGDRTGVIISSLYEGHWAARLAGVRRLPGEPSPSSPGQ